MAPAKQKVKKPFLFYPLFGLLYLLSLLPFWFLYLVSDLLYVLLCYGIKYRRKVILDNLRNAFPKKKEEEIIHISKQFYRHLGDIIVEALKQFSMSQKEMKKRIRLYGTEVFNDPSTPGAIFLSCHYDNVEWYGAILGISLPVPFYAIYTPVKVPVIEHIVRYLREKWQIRTIPMNKAMRQTIKALKETAVVAYVNDQAPARDPQLFFCKFFERPTSAHTGVAKLAVRQHIPLYYATNKKLKRGFYQVDIHPFPIDSNPNNQATIDLITETYHNLLEDMIRENPAHWLWSHRRWKHSPREGDRLSSSLREPQQNP